MSSIESNSPDLQEGEPAGSESAGQRPFHVLAGNHRRTFVRRGVAAAFIASALLFWRALVPFATRPAYIRMTLPAVILPYLLLKVAAILICIAVAATLLFAAIVIVRSTLDRNSWRLGKFVVLCAFCGPVIYSGVVASAAVEAYDICRGTPQPLQFPVSVESDTISYGPYRYKWHAPSKGGSEDHSRFLAIRDAKECIEVRGALGSLNLALPSDYVAKCGPWQARLHPALKQH